MNLKKFLSLNFLGQLFLSAIFVNAIPGKITNFSSQIEFISRRGFPEPFSIFLLICSTILLISGVMKEVYKVLKSSGAVQFIGRENIFPGSISNPNLATKNALKRAQEIIGSSDIDVRIYHDPSRPTE